MYVHVVVLQVASSNFKQAPEPKAMQHRRSVHAHHTTIVLLPTTTSIL